MYRNPTTFATDPSQFYETEERDTEAIANYLQTHHPELKQVFEPYYGNAAIAKVLEANGDSKRQVYTSKQPRFLN